MYRSQFFMAVFTLSLAACSSAKTGGAEYGTRARAHLIDQHGARVGEVTAWNAVEGVLITVRAEHLPPGMHGVHLHAIGDCSDHGLFKASGGHLGGAHGVHGFLHPAAAHLGDLPNIYAHEDGVARAHYFDTKIRINDLHDQDGAALVIHAEPDDYQTQPIGGAGARLLCAAFKPKGDE